MTTDSVTFDKVLRLARYLSPADQARLRAALPPVTDEDTERAIQRQKKQAAIDLLEEWLAEADATTDDDAGDDDWWDEFMSDIDAYRMSSRPLFPGRTRQQ